MSSDSILSDPTESSPPSQDPKDREIALLRRQVSVISEANEVLRDESFRNQSTLSSFTDLLHRAYIDLPQSRAELRAEIAGKLGISRRA